MSPSQFNPPTTLFIVYYKTIDNEWHPCIPTPYAENARYLADLYNKYGSARIVQYDIVSEVPMTKKIRKVRKVVD